MLVAKGTLVFLASLLSVTSAAPSVVPATLSPRDGPATSIDFSSSQWIWTGEEAGPGGAVPVASRPFRKTIESPYGKCAVCATVLITADNLYTLYVNGKEQGSGTDFHTSQVYTVAVESQTNYFAVNATNTGGPAGLIATILIQYNDGSSQTFVTDNTWKTLADSTYDGFQAASPLVDVLWPNAVEEGPVTASPWLSVSLPPALDITQSRWIWTSEATTPGGPVAPGNRAFRKTIVSPPGKCAVCAKAVITVDNAYTLYLNGEVVGTGDDFTQAQYYSMTNLSAESNLFAVEATNTDTVPNPAGVIANILIAFSDGTTETYITNTSWKTLPNTLPPNFQLPSTDDSSWDAATDEGAYGVAPWNQVTVPSA